jgi:hypothetical protein
MFQKDATETMRIDYSDAVSKFKRLEAVLTKSLDALQAARDVKVPATITRTRLDARDAWKACGAGWDQVEQARRKFWQAQCKRHEARLVEAIQPLLGELLLMRRFASLPTVPPYSLIQPMANDIQPAQIVAEEFGDIADSPLNSPAMMRADDEL